VDETVPAEDALEFSKFILNHELCIIEGADHEYTCHQDELSSLVLEFIKVHNDKENNTYKQTRFGRADKPIHSRF
jgi:alpha/beta superfamily hydrolase